MLDVERLAIAIQLSLQVLTPERMLAVDTAAEEDLKAVAERLGQGLESLRAPKRRR